MPDDFSSTSAAGDVSDGMRQKPNSLMERFRAFSELVQTPDDLGPNKAHLFFAAAKAQPGDILVDLGVREGASSFTMLAATDPQHCRVVGVDPSPCPFKQPPRYFYVKSDSITAAEKFDAVQEPLFLVFFDTLHIKEQVMAELNHYWPKIRVGGYAVFHDTEWEPWRHDEYLGTVWRHVIEGVNAFFENGAGHTAVAHYPASHGMTFVQKLHDWNPVVPGMAEALEASRRLTELVCGK